MTDIDTRPPPHDREESTSTRHASEDGRLIRVDRSPRGFPEVRVIDRRWPRLAASILAAVTAVGLVLWTQTVRLLLNWCGDGQLIANCVPPDTWIRNLLLAVALPGIAVGVVATAYLAYFGATGRTWRNWRPVTYAFSAVVLLWLAAFVVAMIAKG